MIFSWLRRRRRRRLLAQPFPQTWNAYLEALPCYRALEADDRDKLRDDLRIIAREKTWEGCKGFEITEEVTVTISAQAALLILNIDHEYYERVHSILVYPTSFLVPGRGRGGVVAEETAALGLAQYRGPVVLSWDAVEHGGRIPTDGRNVVFHEFAHKLDLLDHCADGTPPLAEKAQYEAWVRIMTEEFAKLGASARKGRRTLLDKYGASNPAEFFAVATECFFEKARALKRKKPELYNLLRAYYRQDPAERKTAT